MMKKLSAWVPLAVVGGAMLLFIVVAGFLKSLSGQALRSTFFLPAATSSLHEQTETAMGKDAEPSSTPAWIPSLPTPANTSISVSLMSPISSSTSTSTSAKASVGHPTNVESILQENASLPHEYRLGKRPIQDWDTKRKLWLANHLNDKTYTCDHKPRLFMLTGSQPQPCHGSKGDYLMLKSLKNKIDYCMLHGVQIFYNMAILDKNMDSFWSKLPLIRASMEAHPEAEWFWWVDSDVVITDMLFELPLHMYKHYNLVVHGWEAEVFQKKSVMGLNAGSFLMRNCGWSFRFMDRWASMGPKGHIRDLAGRLQSALLPDRPPDYPGDDQAALIYFMVRERDVWGDKIFLERRYNLNGYWLDMVGNMEGIEAEERRNNGNGINISRPFVTHFAGCQPCTGNRNPAFKEQQCEHEMERALNFADNQVLQSMGFHHLNLNSNDVEPLNP